MDRACIPLLTVVAAGLLSSCAKKPPALPEPPPPAFSQGAWVAHRADVRTYIDHSGTGLDLHAEGHTTDHVTEQCAPTDLPEGAPSLDLEDLSACTTTHESGATYTTLHGTHRVGDVYIGAKSPDGVWSFHPPKIYVPTTFDLGERWSARHGSDGLDQLRRCNVDPTPFCAEGAAVTCVTMKVHHVTWVRNHWCPAHGHMGHEGLVVRSGQPPFWSWSSSPTRADSPLPDLPIEQRPVPDIPLLIGIADSLTPERLSALSPDDARIPDAP